MALRRQDKEFRHPGVSYLDYKQVEMDRVLTAFLSRLWHDGAPSRLSRSTNLTVGDYVDEFLDHPELFDGFDPEITYRWVETHLLDVVNRGKATQAIAGLRPLHGFTYRFRNARQSRPYGADEQLYEMIRHAREERGLKALQFLKEFFFSGVDPRTETPQPGMEVDVETQALINLSQANRNKIEDRPATSKSRTTYPPLCATAADLLADDVLRLLFHEEFIPRSVLVEYLKILFAFHLTLYHLRIIKLLPAWVKAGGADPACGLNRCPFALAKANSGCRYGIGLFLDVAGVPGTPAARLAERSAQVWFGRIPDFVRATFTAKKLNEFAEHLHRRGKLRKPAGGVLGVDEALQLLRQAYSRDRTAFAEARLSGLLESSKTPDVELDAEISQILQLGLDSFTTYIEVISAYRTDFHRRYITQCLDSLMLKNRPGAMIAQPRSGGRRFILDSRLLEVLLQISLLRPGGVHGFHTVSLRVDEFLGVLRERYGLYIDRLPPGDGFGRPSITDHAALRANRAAFVSKLREIGFYSDLSDAYLTQTITPRYVVTAEGSATRTTP